MASDTVFIFDASYADQRRYLPGRRSDLCASSTFGYRDLAYDGAFLWAGDECGVDKIDPATGLRVGGFASPNGQLVRSLAYDPATQHFYTASFNSPIIVFDNTGAVVTTIPADGLNHYGFGWDDV